MNQEASIMIRDVLSDSLRDIDQFLTNQTWLRANRAHLPEIISVRRAMMIVQIKLDNPSLSEDEIPDVLERLDTVQRESCNAVLPDTPFTDVLANAVGEIDGYLA